MTGCLRARIGYIGIGPQMLLRPVANIDWPRGQSVANRPLRGAPGVVHRGDVIDR